MPKSQRPWATIISCVLALLAALVIEWEMGSAPRRAGVPLLVGLPILALGFGLDWIRLTRPSLSRAALVVALALTTFALPFALMSSLGRSLTVVAALGFVVAATAAHVRAVWLGRVVEATYVGQRGTRSVFVNDRACWALDCDDPTSLQPGDRAAFRFRGKEHHQADGPFRGRRQIDGRVTEIAESREAIRRRRKRSARWTTKVIACATGAAVVELTLLALFMV